MFRKFSGFLIKCMYVVGLVGWLVANWPTPVAAEPVTVAERVVTEQIVVDPSSAFRPAAGQLNVAVYRLEDGVVVDRFITEYQVTDNAWRVLMVNDRPFAIAVDRRGRQHTLGDGRWTPVADGSLAANILAACRQVR